MSQSPEQNVLLNLLMEERFQSAVMHRRIVRWLWLRFVADVVIFTAILFVILARSTAQEPSRTLRPDTAVAVALADARAAAKIDPTIPLRLRYVMANIADPAANAAMGYAANTSLNFAGDAYRPIAAHAAGGVVYRVDLLQYANFDERRFRLLADTWDRQQDTQFYLPTDDVREVSAPRFLHGGKAWERASIRVVVPAAHADAGGQLSELIALTQATTPIVSLGQFLRFALGTADGGLYYAFRGIESAPRQGTAEEAFLRRSGIDLNDLGKRNVDQRVVLMGTPTANFRIVEYSWTTGVRASLGPLPITITRDYFEGPVANDRQALENLADRKHDGSEVIAPKADGGLEYALFDAAGGLVAEAPPNLAADRRIPSTGPARLHGAISCIRCHGPQGMFQPAPNYVTWLREIRLPAQGGGVLQFDVFADVLRGKDLQRLVSLYNGETTEVFASARITHSRFSILASGSRTEDATAAVASVYDRWMYGLDPKLALETLGYVVADNAAAVATFNRICPPAPEPLRVTTLRGWGPEMPMRITIDDWLAVYPEVALRVATWESSQPPPPKRGPVQGPPLPNPQGNNR